MPGPRGRRIGVARWLSKQGVLSRSLAEAAVRDGRVRLNGRVVHDPETGVDEASPRVELDGAAIEAPTRRYLALNKPRGLVTTARDEQGRDTVYRCFDGVDLGWIAPVGRLDKASEGLLLFSNDPEWAAAITDPERGPAKSYHVQVAGIPDARTLERMCGGVEVGGESMAVSSVTVLRSGERNAWLEIVLDEGRNRQIRRIVEALGFDVLRLVRVSIGPVALGELPKGQWRDLDAAEVSALARTR